MKRIAALLAALVLSFCFSSAFAEAPLSFPQPLDYGDPAMWPYFAMGDHRDADVFLICPTVDTRSETNSFDLNDKLKARFISTLDGLKGLFDETGRLYSPYYRQMSVPACGLPKKKRKQRPPADPGRLFPGRDDVPGTPQRVL